MPLLIAMGMMIIAVVTRFYLSSALLVYGWRAKSLHEPRTAFNLLVLPCCCCCCHHLHCCLSLSLSLSLYVLGVGRFSFGPPPCLGMYRWMHLSLGCMSFECRITMPPLAWLIFSLQHLNQPSHSTATDWLTECCNCKQLGTCLKSATAGSKLPCTWMCVNNLHNAWKQQQKVGSYCFYMMGSMRLSHLSQTVVETKIVVWLCWTFCYRNCLVCFA